MSQQSASTHRKRLGELLISMRLIDIAQLDSALKRQRETAEPLGLILIQLGFLKEDQLLNVLAAQCGVSPWRLEDLPPTPDAIAKIPVAVCRENQILPVRLNGDLLTLAMKDPLDLDAVDLARNISSCRIQPVMAYPSRLAQAIDDSTNGIVSRTKVDSFVQKAVAEMDKRDDGATDRALLTEEDTRPVVSLVNELLSEAIRQGASDVHIEPRSDRLDVRYRIDGLLKLVRELPPSLAPMLTTRVKILSGMDIVESRLPQDGRVTASIDGREVDLRVSSLPGQFGQRIVLRILDKSKSLKSLDQIGFNFEHLNMFRDMIHRPYGILLVTGPTGSGKTTTLYAAVKELLATTRNIMTCEDPIEYEVDGVNQSQVNDKVGLTFSAQLRAILRQDPDVILIGEIRDRETAEIAVRASLTGHLVLSTLHCNDAPSAIPRLLDIGINPYLLGASLIGVMSQRLLRTFCPSCKGAKCDHCGQTGFKGRMAVHEIMPISKGVAASIGRQDPVESLLESAFECGYRPMSVEAHHAVEQGITSFEEARSHVYFGDHASQFLKLAS